MLSGCWLLFWFTNCNMLWEKLIHKISVILFLHPTKLNQFNNNDHSSQTYTETIYNTKYMHRKLKPCSDASYYLWPVNTEGPNLTAPRTNTGLASCIHYHPNPVLYCEATTKLTFPSQIWTNLRDVRGSASTQFMNSLSHGVETLLHLYTRGMQSLLVSLFSRQFLLQPLHQRDELTRLTVHRINTRRLCVVQFTGQHHRSAHRVGRRCSW